MHYLAWAGTVYVSDNNRTSFMQYRDTCIYVSNVYSARADTRLLILRPYEIGLQKGILKVHLIKHTEWVWQGIKLIRLRAWRHPI